jgi:hypothetical protein
MQIGTIVKKRSNTFDTDSNFTERTGTVESIPFAETTRAGTPHWYVLVCWGKSKKPEKVSRSQLQIITEVSPC